jgi:uncharacterized protein (TIGR00299 family) protein
VNVLYFDCFSGASGDMVLGALIDLGVELDSVRTALGSLAIDPATVWTERVTRAGVTATKFCVRGEDPEPTTTSVKHHHHRAHHHHPHRTLEEIGRLVDRSALSGAGKARVRHLFTRLGEAEAAIHGTSLDRVHLHEVGALDSIIDIVGAVHALEVLGADRIVASPLNVGGGTVTSAHGVYPVPAPATAALLTGVPVYGGPQQMELLTPTGALLISDYAEAYGPVPPMRVGRTGYGAGTRDVPHRPNVLRVMLGEVDSPVAGDVVTVIETEIDDMSPQLYGPLLERLLAAGAHDVYYTPVFMKKNRPGTLLTAIAPPEARERVTATIFRESTTIGVRYRDMQRECLEREIVSVRIPAGTVRIKVARRNGTVLNAAPEFDDCVRLATASAVSVKEIQAAATKAWLDAQGT